MVIVTLVIWITAPEAIGRPSITPRARGLRGLSRGRLWWRTKSSSIKESIRARVWALITGSGSRGRREHATTKWFPSSWFSSKDRAEILGDGGAGRSGRRLFLMDCEGWLIIGPKPQSLLGGSLPAPETWKFAVSVAKRPEAHLSRKNTTTQLSPNPILSTISVEPL